jgi:hypothetical protein
MHVLEPVMVVVIAILAYAIPIGIGALVLTMVLRHHRREMVRELRILLEQQKTPASSPPSPP